MMGDCLVMGVLWFGGRVIVQRLIYWPVKLSFLTFVAGSCCRKKVGKIFQWVKST